MVFDGRWGVTALIQRPRGVVRVPLELDTRTPAQFVSIERFPGRPTKYTVEVGNSGSVRISPDPERAGPSKVYVNLYDVFGNVVRARHLVLTVAAGDGPASQQPVRAAGKRFVADAELAAGPQHDRGRRDHDVRRPAAGRARARRPGALKPRRAGIPRPPELESYGRSRLTLERPCSRRPCSGRSRGRSGPC